jgi:hypothetical protein
MKKVKKFMELQRIVNGQIDSKGEADTVLIGKLDVIGNSLNSHEVELLMEMWNKEFIDRN